MFENIRAINYLTQLLFELLNCLSICKFEIKHQLYKISLVTELDLA